MQYLFFIFSGAAFIFSGFLYFWVRRSVPVLLSKTRINRVVKLANFGLPVCVFKNGDWMLFSLKNQTFTLNFKGKNWLKVQFFADNLPICVKQDITQKASIYGVYGKMHSTELCVKQQKSTIFNKMHSTVKILIQKNHLPFSVGANKKSIKFDDFKLELICNGNVKLDISDDSLQYETTADKVELDYSSLGLQTLSNKEIREITMEKFGLPELNFEKPDFNHLYKKDLKGDYARDCVQHVKFRLTEQPNEHRINLTERGFSKWTVFKKWGKHIILEDWLTNYSLKIKTGSLKNYLCCWWGEVFLCPDNSDYIINELPMDKVKEGRINLFKYPYNWQFFPKKMQFDFAFSMLKYMNKNDNSKWLADKDIADFILHCLPENPEMKKEHYNFIRELYPYIVLKSLRRELLLFMQKYEQMFYKNI